jgi:hypothetical protein
VHAVYLTLDGMPAMGEWFTYTCPNCKQEAAFQVGAMSVDVEIPPGAIVGVPYQP